MGDFSWASLERPFTCLAPMEDVTDTVFRRIVAEASPPDVFFTEFTSVDGLQSPGRDEVARRLEFTEAERPLIAQIWGVDPANFYRTSVELVDRGFDGIDINMGCPVEKIVKKGCCGALALDPPRAAEMVHATVSGAGSLPVSVKTRLGFHKPQTEEWCGFLLNLPIAALIVHGRTVVQQSEGRADWDEIRKVVGLRDRVAPDIAIVGNGDVGSRSDVETRPSQYGVDGVMVGRGVFHDLYIFDKTDAAPEFLDLPVEAKLRALRRHIELYRTVWADRRNVHVLKKFVKIYISGFPGAAGVRDRFMTCDGYDDLLATVDAVRADT